MFPADSPLAALSVTWGTLRGQTVLTLAGAVRMGRGQGPDDCGWALACAQIWGKNTVLRVTLLWSGVPDVSAFATNSVAITGLQVWGHTDVPEPGTSGLCHREDDNTKVSGGGTLQVRFHTSSPGRSDQAKGTHVQMLRVKCPCPHFPEEEMDVTRWSFKSESLIP